MMNDLMDATNLKKYYVDWLANEISVNKVNNYLEVTSPFLDINNDYLQVYVKIINSNQIHLTDDGSTINNLNMLGIEIDSPKRLEIFNGFLKKYGIKNEKNELVANSSQYEFPQKLVRLMQAMLDIYDMFMLSKTKIASLFNEDIKNFFYDNHIFYIENVNFIGKSGLSYSYDYALQMSESKPERLCKAINTPDLQSFKMNAFMWDDTKANRNPNSEFIVLLNDKTPVSPSVLEAYNNYNIKTLLWSEKEKNIELLSA